MSIGYETSIFTIECDHCHATSRISARDRAGALTLAQRIGWKLDGLNRTYCSGLCERLEHHDITPFPPVKETK